MSNFITNAIGTGAGDLYYWLGGGSSLQTKLDGQQSQLATLNQKDYAPGGQIYLAIQNSQGTAAADAAWQQVQKNASTSASEGTVKSQLQSAGQAGAAKGLSSLASGLQSAVSGIFGTLFKLMPWQAWIAVAGGVFLYFGGLNWLKRQLA